MNQIENQMIAIQTLLADSDPIARTEGFDLLFDLWIKHEEPEKFNVELIPIALEHDDLLSEFKKRINELVIKDNITDFHLSNLHKNLSKKVEEARGQLIYKIKQQPDTSSDAEPIKEGKTLIAKVDSSQQIRRNYAIWVLAFPLGLNLLASILLHIFAVFFPRNPWKNVYTMIFFISLLSIHILLSYRFGKRVEEIKSWEYFEKFERIKDQIVGGFLILLGGLLTNAIYDFIKGQLGFDK